MMLVVSIDLAPKSLVITTCIGVSLEVRQGFVVRFTIMAG